MTVVVLQPLGKKHRGLGVENAVGLKKQPFYSVCSSRSMLSFLYAG